MHTTTTETSAASLWQYNASLLARAAEMITRLRDEAPPDFVYARAVGPHTRHIIEHYQALFAALGNPTLGCVDYDARHRDLRMQTDPTVAMGTLQQLILSMKSLASDPSQGLDMPLTTRLQAGLNGEMELNVMTTLGRELLFLSSHTVHHYALISQYCRAAGVDLGEAFGKAPATVAFELANRAMSA